MKFLEKIYFAEYKQKITPHLTKLFQNLEDKKSPDFLQYLTEASAVYSSNIEGNPMDLNSFMNTKLLKAQNKPKDFIEITDLIQAYSFAQKNELNEKNFLETHNLLAKNLLSKTKCGQYRHESVGVFGNEGLIYLAVEAENIPGEVQKLFETTAKLLHKKLKVEEIFYYASMLHLHLAHIHPFADGNGRLARLLEKWFIASYLDKNAWLIPSEQYYKENIKAYYKNINLGVNYYETDYTKCLPFLLMLPQAIQT